MSDQTSKSANEPEPAPQPGKATPTWDLVIADIRERDAIGAAKYGVRHQHDNGRNHLVDAYQELLDGAVYLRAEIEKRKGEVDPRIREAEVAGITSLLLEVQQDCIREHHRADDLKAKLDKVEQLLRDGISRDERGKEYGLAELARDYLAALAPEAPKSRPPRPGEVDAHHAEERAEAERLEATEEGDAIACLYCDWQAVRPRFGVRAALAEHVAICAKHPQRAVETERDAALAKLAALEGEVIAVLGTFAAHAVRVREGDGPEDLAASLAVTALNVKTALEARPLMHLPAQAAELRERLETLLTRVRNRGLSMEGIETGLASCLFLVPIQHDDQQGGKTEVRPSFASGDMAVYCQQCLNGGAGYTDAHHCIDPAHRKPEATP